MKLWKNFKEVFRKLKKLPTQNVASPRKREHLVRKVELLYSVKSKNWCKSSELELAFSVDNNYGE